ncbi:MAG TPA: hypothetical protein VKG64_07580 [Methylomirabilota bacterium]|nr:hypothetical protein [Methylomirabilota bacterium]
MPAIRRISELTVERRDHRLCVRFKLNVSPDRNWIGLFKAHAASSVLGAANVIFDETDAFVEVGRPSSPAELATALDCFIECANLRLRTFAGHAPEDRPLAAALSRIAAARMRPHL